MEITGSSSLVTRHYSTKPRSRKYVKGYEISSFSRNLSNIYRRKLFG